MKQPESRATSSGCGKDFDGYCAKCGGYPAECTPSATRLIEPTQEMVETACRALHPNWAQWYHTRAEEERRRVKDLMTMVMGIVSTPSQSRPMELPMGDPHPCDMAADELDRHLAGEHHAIQAQSIDSPMNACSLKETCLWLKRLALTRTPPSAIEEHEDTKRLNWLFKRLNDNDITDKVRDIGDTYASRGVYGIALGDFRAAIDAVMLRSEYRADSGAK